MSTTILGAPHPPSGRSAARSSAKTARYLKRVPVTRAEEDEANLADAADLRALAAAIQAPELEVAEVCDERKLEKAAADLRRFCLQRSHEPADSTLKSPCEGTTAHVPGGDRVPVGYERELDVSVLETRGTSDYAAPAGWRSARIICRSGQASLACLLHLALKTADGRGGVLRTTHAGRYFETKALLNLWPQNVLQRARADAPEVDLLIGEPVYCDGKFGVSQPDALPRVRHALLLDTTLSGPRVDLAPWFARHLGPIAAVFRSGLKLDQAGLELANVGIIQLMVRDNAGIDIDDLAEELRKIRSLTGTGLTLDELSALSVPWFLDRDYQSQYTSQLFDHNEKLARAIGRESVAFESSCHPALVSPPTPAPFCAIRLRQGDLQAHRQLLAHVETEVGRRGIVATKGGSFGFRGIRYELVEPNPADGEPFLRVAVGYRGGRSLTLLCELFADLSRKNSIP